MSREVSGLLRDELTLTDKHITDFVFSRDLMTMRKQNIIFNLQQIVQDVIII